ncbi:hypothetical protein PAXRUDRAFT_44795, partial [Paxillus rubicundulus Ve08.2h10]
QKQFLLRLAYATTFNGCQGLTLSRTALDLHSECFAHGQLYTTLSHIHHHNNSYVLFSNLNEEKDMEHVVYKYLLL